MSSIDPVGGTSGWRPSLPERARKGLAAKHVLMCDNCGGRDELGENEDGKIVCSPCWSKGGHGFAWWRS